MAVVSAGSSLGGFAGGSVLSRLLVVISGDVSPLNAALAQAQSSTLSFSQKTGILGNALTRSVSLPALAAAGGMIFLNTQFNRSLATIAGLTPVVESGEESIESLNDKILELATTLPTSPNEIAQSFYLAASAGLESAEAFEVVRLSAQGAAVGMGESADISKVLIAALNNYGPAGLTATQAMDTLTAAIREGTAEPDELAIALGRLLPVAEQAGVAFDEVVGSVAALTNLGVPARVATTSLRALFSQLLAPTIQATQTLQALGLTAEDVRKALATGPLEAFELINKATKENADLTRNLIPQIRGLTAFYGLTGDQLESYRHILEQTENSQGDFQRAFEAIQATPAFQFEVGINQLRVAAIELGAVAIPIFNKLIDVIQVIAETLIGLPGPAKAALVGLLLLAGASGPVLKLVSAMTAMKTVTLDNGKVMATSVPTAKAFGATLLTLGVSSLIAFGSLSELANGASDLTTVLIAGVASITAVRTALMALQGAAQAGKLGINALESALIGIGPGVLTGIAVGIGLLVTAMVYLAGSEERARKAALELGEGLAASAKSGKTFKEALENIADEEARARLAALAKELEGVNDAMQQPTGDVLGFITDQSIENLRVTLGELADGFDEVGAEPLADELRNKFIPALIASAEAGVTIDDAMAQAGTSFEELQSLLAQGQGVGAETFQEASAAAADLATQQLALDKAQEDMFTSATAAIGGFETETSAIQKLADITGSSTDFIESKLREFGTTATEVIVGEAIPQFVKASGAMGDMSLAAAQAASEMDEAFAKLTESLASDFSLFGELPEKATQSLDKYLDRAKQLSAVALQQTQDIARLQQRGVPTGLIDQLISAGPGVLNKFAESSKGQLDKLIKNYELGLAAIDAAILRENEHQVAKGEGMVQGFADAILGSKHLTDAAAARILDGIGGKIATGDLKPEAVRLITQFAQGMEHGPRLTSEQAEKMLLSFEEAITTRRNFNQDGRLLVTQVAEGIARATGIPVSRVIGLVMQVAAAVRSNSDELQRGGRGLAIAVEQGLSSTDVTNVGREWAMQLDTGIREGSSAPISAARETAEKINTAFRESLHSSPMMASYYAGIEYVKQFSQGVSKQARHASLRTITIQGPPPRVGAGTGAPGDTRIVSLDVRLDRNRTAQEIDWAQRTAGHR